MIRKLNLPDSATLDGLGRHSAASAVRNLHPIQLVLNAHLPATGRALELASGTGQHIVAHALSFPGLEWQPSEPDPARLAMIDAWATEAALGNLRPALGLDACAPGWGAAQGPRALVLVVNLLHLISDGEMAVLLDEAAQALGPLGIFAIYGPFLREGAATSPGDAAFDADLRAQDPAIGYKDLGVVCSVLEALQLRVHVEPMPANNVMILAKRPA